jgi:hypothetical protein
LNPLPPPLHNRIAAFTDDAACPDALVASLGEFDLGVNPDSEQLLLTIEAIFQSPVLRAI